MARPSSYDIARVVEDAMKMSLPRPTPRRVRLARFPGKIDAVIGMRRSGKTWLLYQHAHELMSAGIPRDRILYLNFEDERLAGMETADLQHVPEAYFAARPVNTSLECHFLFDEIQNVAGWERFLRRLLDRGGLRIVVTGSSAKLLGREIATALRGRSLTTELLPFGFDEVLRHRGIELPDRWPVAEAARAVLRHAFREYFEGSGFPELQGADPIQRRRVLQDYVDVALFRDVVERHGATNIPALRWLVRRLVTRPSDQFTVHRAWRDLHAQGIAIGKDTLHDYVDWLTDAFLVLPVPAWSGSERASALRPRKVYLVDHGLASAMSVRAGEARGHLLENIVYTTLRRRGYDCRWLSTAAGREVDFVATRHEGMELVQVCLDPSDPATLARELASLDEAMPLHQLRNATIVTLDTEREIEIGTGRVRLVPAWQWVLEGLTD